MKEEEEKEESEDEGATSGLIKWGPPEFKGSSICTRIKGQAKAKGKAKAKAKAKA